MRTWGGAVVSVLVCTRGVALEMDWRKFFFFFFFFGGGGGFSRYYNITNISLRACMHCMY